MINITLRDGYINLLKSSLLNELYIEEEAKLIHTFNCIINNILPKFDEYLNIHSLSQYKTIFKLLNCCQFRSTTKESFSIVNHCSNMG